MRWTFPSSELPGFRQFITSNRIRLRFALLFNVNDTNCLDRRIDTVQDVMNYCLNSNPGNFEIAGGKGKRRIQTRKENVSDEPICHPDTVYFEEPSFHVIVFSSRACSDGQNFPMPSNAGKNVNKSHVEKRSSDVELVVFPTSNATTTKQVRSALRVRGGFFF